MDYWEVYNLQISQDKNIRYTRRRVEHYLCVLNEKGPFKTGYILYRTQMVAIPEGFQ